MSQPIHGLVLVGGESRRMGHPKALLSYHGRESQLERTARLLAGVCPKVFVSLRPTQHFPLPEGSAPIYDAFDTVKGPLGGILSAMAAHPEADWLVLACDLPLLQAETLSQLVQSYRARAPQLTAYRSSYDGLPEPLCAIYPSGIDAELLETAKKLGKFCPRKLLIEKESRLINQTDPHWLDNINTPEEFESLNNRSI